ncbi:TVP38/TMEM64 family protein [Falsiroseomonas oryzae]|uniref:TVP38/TMEM64 family protein n=1 Tax=Falsiroseomonas oryzae TaxID=2766473 RepID=UPI0022EB097D|nr:VTT domain-containing protein [Roseomonas sp. MO-31]
MDQVLAAINDPERMRALVDSLGPWGPPVIVLGLAAAIVFSPVPSAPIALAAGALYGGAWGTAYVVAGSLLGAVVAFLIARRFGYGPARRIPWIARWLDRTQSQAMLAWLVFASRLLPFLSFDAVSYAAGLTPLRLPWFALATFAGVLPISILLVRFGEHMAQQGAAWIGTAVLVAGGITLLPLLWRRLRR